MGMLWTCHSPTNYHPGPSPRVWAKYRVRLDNRVQGADYLEQAWSSCKVGWRLESSALSLFIFLCDFSVETWRGSSVKMYRCICKDWRFPLPWRNLLACLEVSPRQRKLLMFSFTVLQMFLALLLCPYALSSSKSDQKRILYVRDVFIKVLFSFF